MRGLLRTILSRILIDAQVHEQAVDSPHPLSKLLLKRNKLGRTLPQTGIGRLGLVSEKKVRDDCSFHR